MTAPTSPSTCSGDPDQAGFVQIMQGRSTDPDRAKQLMAQDADKWAAFRPDMIGSVAVGHDDGAYTMVMYFTSEADAREGERKEVPPELRAQHGGDEQAQRRRARVLRPQAARDQFPEVTTTQLYDPTGSAGTTLVRMRRR